MDRLNVAVIGCGKHAGTHFGMIANEPRVRLAAIAELDRERLDAAAAEHSPERAFLDYREMLDTCELDLVYVVTWPGHLLPIVLDCLDRNLNVSVEKSPGMNSGETEHMAEAERRSKGRAIVSFNRRYFPEVLAVRRMVRERGGAVHCAATYNKRLSVLGTSAKAHVAPDPIIVDGIHHVDLLRWLAGDAEGKAAKPVEVYSHVQDGEREGAHRQNAVVRFDTGAFGVLMSHYGVGGRIQRAEVHAEDMSAYLDLTSGRNVQVYLAEPQPSGTTKGGLVEEPLDLEAVGGPEFNETAHFVDCIIEDRDAWSTLDDAVITMKLCEAIRRGHMGSL